MRWWWDASECHAATWYRVEAQIDRMAPERDLQEEISSPARVLGTRLIRLPAFARGCNPNPVIRN